ncbi:MAG: glycosyltransferase [Prosthecobacter sp.]|uniref:glycosyltransferase family 2 protein n=1 Tax=Prosthecobacter sp. TaxID=1965333 RepID=UPI003BB11D80
MPAPRVSVLIPCYNYAQYVGRAIESVLGQTHDDLELIVVDNGSTDDSWQVIQQYHDPRLKSFRLEANRGMCGGWAFGLEQCLGEWFSFLSADDYLDSKKHEILLNYLAKHPEADVAGGYVEQVDSFGRRPEGTRWMEDVINAPRDYNALESWMNRHFLCIPAAFYRRELCVAPPDGLNGVADYYFHLTLLRRGARFAQVQEVLAYYRWHEDNTTRKERSTVVEQFAYCFAMQLLPCLKESNQMGRAAETICSFFELYTYLLRTTPRHDLGGIMLCMFWPEWVAENCPDFPALVAVDWENRTDGHQFHGVRAMMNDAFLKWSHQSPAVPPAAATHKRQQKNTWWRNAGRSFERRLRHFLRGR